MSFHVPEAYRVTSGPLATTRRSGNNGAFIFPSKIGSRVLAVIASDGTDWAKADLKGEPWEHVSVHVEEGRRQRTPLWSEMCQVKDLFWDDEDVVIQFHPRKSEYVNNHPHTLHLWRPTQTTLPTPPLETVGMK